MAFAPAAYSRIGSFTVEVDGAWDMQDLLALSEAFSESYGYFYALVVQDEEVATRIHQLIQKRFWDGDFASRRFGKLLYGQIPLEESLKLRSFSYSSPGTLTVIGILPALWMAARIAKAWASAGNDFFELFARIDKYFENRRRKKKTKVIRLDADMASDVDDAREIAFELGTRLGFDAISTERIIEITGNPITAVKYMVGLANEAKKLAKLENDGLLKLPQAPDGQMQLTRTPRSGVRSTVRSGVPVKNLKRKPSPKK